MLEQPRALLPCHSRFFLTGAASVPTFALVFSWGVIFNLSVSSFLHHTNCFDQCL